MNIHEARKLFQKLKAQEEESKYIRGHSGIQMQIYQPNRNKTIPPDGKQQIHSLQDGQKSQKVS